MHDNLTIRAINFYKNKDSAPFYTTDFIKKYQQSGGGYIDFARIFKSDDKSVEELRNKIQDPKKVAQLNNYIKIEDLIEQHDLDKVDALRGLDPGFILNIQIDKTAGEPNQKWHFLVSYCAQCEIKGSTANIFKESITCPELWLWLIEEARDNIILNDEDVKKVYEQAIIYKTIGNKFGKEEWKYFLNIYREKVKAIIMK